MTDEAKELIRYTDDEFYEYLENNDVKAELIDGFIIVDMGQPTPFHQRLSFLLTRCFFDYIIRNKKKCEVYQEIETRFDKDNVVVPDIIVTCKPENLDSKRLNGAPELIIEIVSGNRYNDYGRKLTLYKQAGVKEYMIVDPKLERVTVWFFEDEDSPYIYGFTDDIIVRMTAGESEPLTVNIAGMTDNIQ